MKFTMEVDESYVMTIPEIIKKLGIEDYCQNATEGSQFVFTFKNDNGSGTFDIASGEAVYDGDEGDVVNVYEEEMFSNSLMEALDCSCLYWGENAYGDVVAFVED